MSEDADARPPMVGWWFAFPLVGVIVVMMLNALTATDAHAHGGGLAALPHGVLYALPIAMALVVALRLKPRQLYAALALVIGGVLAGAWW